jgi:alpha-D-ribose 1-methylphosphonate 5-triphosphate synthase subunit PhnH
MNAQLTAGFSDPVFQSQACFRSVLQALARPGSVWPLQVRAPLGVALSGAMAHLLLTLTDPDTPVWWQQPDRATQDWLRFHTGAPATEDPAQAFFAVVNAPAQLAELGTFAQGSDAAPEFSTTILIELPGWTGGAAQTWSGPGINGTRTLHLPDLPDNFGSVWNAQSAHFPCGVDLVFCHGNELLGLPRTTRIHSSGSL